MYLTAKKEKTLKRIMNYVVFMGPAVLLFVVIGLIPFFYEIWYSFTNWDGIHANYQFVGLKNYMDVLTNDPKYWHAMWFTIKFAFCVLVFSNLLGFIWAYGLSKAIPFRNVMRAGFYIPRIVGGVVLGFLWRFIITELFPVIGEATGIGWFSQSWFQTEASSFWAMVIVMTWSMAGYMMIIYIAGLQNLPTDVLEAAEIDGASSWQKLRRVTIPMIMPSITICTFLTLTNSFKLFDQNFALTAGAPMKKTAMLALDIYNTFYGRIGDEGVGQAKAVLFFLMVAAIAALQLRATRSREVEQ